MSRGNHGPETIMKSAVVVKKRKGKFGGRTVDSPTGGPTHGTIRLHPQGLGERYLVLYTRTKVQNPADCLASHYAPLSYFYAHLPS